jgi:copper resistance protein B
MTRTKLTLLLGSLGLAAAALALGEVPQESAAPNHDNQTASEAGHVPPDPPQHPMGDMRYREMAAMMQMDDTARTAKVLLDQLEWRDLAEGNASIWDVQGWYGGDSDKFGLKTQGERVASRTQNAHADLLWDHIVARRWSVQAGARQDFGEGPARTWAALGVQGLAPYWFDTEATLYIGGEGRTAVRLKAEYELLFTQRLILQPEGEANLYGKPDPARHLGSGLSDLEIGLRLRYEVRREIAPYVGVVWSQLRASGRDVSDVRLVAGLRAWF